MAHPAVERAVRVEVRKQNLPDSLADKLLSWYDEVTDGNEQIQDKTSAGRRIQLILESVGRLDASNSSDVQNSLRSS